MTVGEVMKHAASFCGPEVTLAEAGLRLTEVGCAVLTVVTPAGRVLGVITDRDICRALSARAVLASAVQVRDAMTPDPFTIARSEDLGVALARMRAHRVRRLPVTDTEGRLEGLLSLDDVIMRTPFHDCNQEAEDVLRTFRAINQHSCPPI